MKRPEPDLRLLNNLELRVETSEPDLGFDLVASKKAGIRRS